MSQFDEWKSYSVAFRVEKQQDEQDEVRINHVKIIELNDLQDSRDRFLVKGSYPGLAVIRPTPAKTKVNSGWRKFYKFDELRDWMIRQSTKQTLVVDFNDFLTTVQRDSVLRAAERLPTEQLHHIEEVFKRNGIDAEENIKLRATKMMDGVRSRLVGITDTIFDVEVMIKSHDMMKDAYATLNVCIAELKKEPTIWEGVDESTKTVLNLPVRLKNQMTDICEFYRKNPSDDLDRSLEKLVGTKGKTFGKEPESEPSLKSMGRWPCSRGQYLFFNEGGGNRSP